MSQENVETVRRVYEAFAQADLETLFASADPDIDAYFDAPHTYRGHAGMEELFAAQAEVFNPFRLMAEEILDAGDRVVAIAHAGGVARASGVEVMGRFGHLWSIEGAKVVHFREYKDLREALEAAGLSE